jgi:hypothetical protein
MSRREGSGVLPVGAEVTRGDGAGEDSTGEAIGEGDQECKDELRKQATNCRSILRWRYGCWWFCGLC